MDRIDLSFNDFHKYVLYYNKVCSSSGITYIGEDEVIKSLYYNKDENSLNNLSCFDDKLFTPPKSLIYLDSNLYGIKMDNGGNSLIDILIENPTISFDKKYEMCQNLKEIGEFLRNNLFYNIHGDITLNNLVYDGFNLRLVDLDSMPVFEQLIRVVSYYNFWYSHYSVSPLLDNLAINYLTYLLLNFDDLSFLEELYKDCKLYNAGVMINLTNPVDREKVYIEHPNKVFDSGVFLKERAFMQCKCIDDSLIEDRKNRGLYLIDYLK